MNLTIIQFLARFDLMAKYLYIKYKDLNINSNYFKELYHNHIITFNNCWEHPGTKTNIDDFYKAFDELINNIKNNGFDQSCSIPLGKNKVIVNGAHRFVTSFYYKIKPEFVNINEFGNIEYDYKFFLNRIPNPKLNVKYTDSMALEYIKLNENIRCMIVYPSGYENADFLKLENILSDYAVIYYDKTATLNKTGVNNLIKELYRHENWIGGTFPKGYSGKAQLCVNNKCNQTRIYLFHMRNLNKLIELKEKCRNLFGIGKHSLHVSDYTKDTFRIASSLLNKNSIYFLNHGTNDISENTKRLLTNYFNKICNNSEEFCLTSSLIMEMFGLRNAKDIDYLHMSNHKLNDTEIGLHDGIWEKYYSKNKDDIIYNPDNHFYFNGVKFATLEIVKKMKENRGEEKDFRDIKLIENQLIKL